MGASCSKQYLPLLGKTVLEHTLHTLLQERRLETIVVTTAVGDQQWQALEVFSDPRIKVVDGGAERSHSVINGLRALAGLCREDDWVLVHDVARPCISLVDINNMLGQLASHRVGGLLAVPCNDTIKRVNGGVVAATVDRSALWQAQTPQMFRYQLLLSCLSEALQQGLLITDEASAVEAAGFSPQVVEGSSSNIKITTPEDLRLAEFYLQASGSVCE
jgi:2-C-methyl-D-erythritol 4-phosphate cytidylyltransferase